MSGTDYKFEGWLGKDEESINGKMEWGQFEPKEWDVRSSRRPDALVWC